MTDIDLHTGPADASDVPFRATPFSAAEPAWAASEDALGFDPAVRGLAELAAHRSAGSPLALGLLGPPGSGKSFALSRLIELVGAFSKAGDKDDSPYLPNVVVARVDASAARDPATALAASVFAAMQAAGGKMGALAEDAATAGADPVDAARVASERLIDLRRRLDGERRTLSELSGRRARLSETVLYQSGGSRIDSWARANRGRIEGRLRAFGFISGDPVATYKDLVRDVAENRGVMGRISAFAHAMWAFRGQAKLIVLAVMFFLLAWALGLAQDSQGLWAGWLGGQGDMGARTAGWINANGPAIFGMARSILFWAGVACIALNAFRAARFMSPIWRGVSLLDADMQTGARELDTLIGNQTRLVDDLASQSEAQARRAEEAERRAAAFSSRASDDLGASPFAAPEGDAGSRQARHFFRAIARDAGSSAGPQRILVAVDELDSLPPKEAATFVDQAAGLLAQAPFALLVAADPQRLAQGWGGDGADQIARRIQIGVRVDAASSGDYARLVRKLLATGEVSSVDEPAPDLGASIWDRPVSPDEAALLESLAPLAGRTPRCVAQFVTAYRLSRTRTDKWPLLAFALALDVGGTHDERAAIASVLGSSLPDQAFDPSGLSSRLWEALASARTANGGTISASEMRAAITLASTYSLRV
ncbi:MAG: P-loop NTPase fold protein [Beijerinckiaceae bacterium]|nr:P-loop NTPase fold protein [Beijerinckiaceae bacterium]